MERPTMFEAFLLSTLAKAFTLSKSAEEHVLCRIRPALHIANVESNPIAYLLYQRVDTDLMIINLDGCKLVAINFTRYHFGLSYHRNPSPALICKNHRCPPKLSSHRLSICAVGITINPLGCFFNNESLSQLRRCIWNFILAQVQHIPSHIRADLVTKAATSLPSLRSTHPVQ